MQNFLDTSAKRICKLSGVKANDAITGICQPRITLFVSGNSSRGEVMLSIDFYDKLGRVDREIRNVRANRRLATDVNSVELFELSQIAPKPFLALSRAVTKSSRLGQGSGGIQAW